MLLGCCPAQLSTLSPTCTPTESGIPTDRTEYGTVTSCCHPGIQHRIQHRRRHPVLTAIRTPVCMVTTNRGGLSLATSCLHQSRRISMYGRMASRRCVLRQSMTCTAIRLPANDQSVGRVKRKVAVPCKDRRDQPDSFHLLHFCEKSLGGGDHSRLFSKC